MNDNEVSLIVNADDFGQSRGINQGVVIAIERGIVTSASLMVRWPAAAEAAAFARCRPQLSLGLHLDLGEWVYRDGNWNPAYQVVDTESAAAVAAELSRQLDSFRRLVGRPPTHLDSHQHVHRHEPVRSIVIAAAAELGVPLRDHTSTVRYCGAFYGQTGTGEPLPANITVEALVDVLAGLPPGCTELGCHPGIAEGTPSVYNRERAVEVQVLCDPAVRAAIATKGIRLRSFHYLAPVG